MLFMLDEIMTPREACDRWGDYTRSIENEVEEGKDSKLVDELIREGKLKYYKPEEKQRGEWILTAEAMNILFPKNNRRD